jgi:transcriptional regulator with PAS, ATPase and Fis domain
MLVKYDYPGNVRELGNIMERAVVIAREDMISLEDLPFRDTDDHGASGFKSDAGILRQSIEELEQQMIIAAMEKAGDHQTKAAEALGISERMLRYKLKKYGLKE